MQYVSRLALGPVYTFGQARVIRAVGSGPRGFRHEPHHSPPDALQLPRTSGSATETIDSTDSIIDC
jgi:hypothetical protein